jgi:tRNA modification GTPase
MSAKDTIVALSTPPGRSGIGVIRLSGPTSLDITRRLINDESFSPEPNKVFLRPIFDIETKEVLDQSLITYFKSPHSFTGEDVIELSCHGSPVLLQSLIRIILSLDARLADPGEFTLRALSNGQMNLSQAEAVRDIIDAQTEAAAKQAVRQLRGELSAYLQPIKDSLLEITVQLESRLEFVEDDLPELAAAQISQQLENLSERLESLASTFRSGRLLRDGLKVALVGRPNVGKSSLFNSLLASDRAIVTDIPGTTRDSLSELTNIKGVPVLLTDTAGVRISSDVIENIGVERTRRAINEADLIVVVIDGSQDITDEDKDIFLEVSQLKHILAINKCDLKINGFNEQFFDNGVSKVIVSAKTGEGLDSLRSSILEPFSEIEITNSGLMITDTRHYDLLNRTLTEINKSCHLLAQGTSEEIILVGLYNALTFLGQITGETTPDEVLGMIFSTFCIGK